MDPDEWIPMIRYEKCKDILKYKDEVSTSVTGEDVWGKSVSCTDMPEGSSREVTAIVGIWQVIKEVKM